MNLFSYESKPMQILMQLGDLIILNLLYLLCCIPVFTIGAAQAGLYSGIKTLLDPDDDTYCTKAFFKGFRSGFGQVTMAWCLLFALELLLGVVAYLCVFYQKTMQADLPLWAALIALAIVALFQSLVTAFHSRFSCTALQLIRNAWFLATAYPIRSLAVAALTWFPIIFFALSNITVFMSLTPVWLTIYFSGAFCFCHTFLKKPFQILIDHFNEQKEASAEEASQEA